MNEIYLLNPSDFSFKDAIVPNPSEIKKIDLSSNKWKGNDDLQKYNSEEGSWPENGCETNGWW